MVEASRFFLTIKSLTEYYFSVVYSPISDSKGINFMYNTAPMFYSQPGGSASVLHL